MKKNVLIVGDWPHYIQPFRKFGRFSRDQGLFNTPDQIALVVLTGGADISPSIYGHKPSSLTWCTPKRDVFEMLTFRRARRHNLPIIGVCRGAQLLCALAGGTLFQHVEGHMNGNHTMTTWDGRVMYVTSTHHQMQNPPPNAEIIAWSEKRRSDIYIGQDDEELPSPPKEYECVHYPNIRAVGVQYHPEMMSPWTPGHQFAEELVDRFLLNPTKNELSKV